MRVICLLTVWVCLLAVGGTATGDPVCSFAGELTLAEQALSMDIRFTRDKTVKIDAKRMPDGKLHLEAGLQHVQAPFFDLSTVLNATLEPVRKPDGTVDFYRGMFQTRYSLIDFKPIQELSGNFEIRESRLVVQALSWSGHLLKGYIRLLPPFDCDMRLQLESMPLDQFFKLIGVAEDFEVQGFADGFLTFSGFLNKPFIRGGLESIDGILDELEYESLTINFEGLYPLMTVHDSVVAQTNGLVYSIKGVFDLSKTENRAQIEKEIASLEFAPLVAESLQHREWTIKRKQEEGTRGRTEFKYKLQKQGDKDSPFENESDMLGIERSIKF